MNICSVETCDREVNQKTLQLCQAHYHRFWRDGDVRADVPLRPEYKKPLPVIDFEDGTRQRLECSKRLPLESFHRDKISPLGRRKTCKACRVATETARYHLDPEAVSARVRAHRQENLAAIRLRESEYYDKHRTARIAAASAQVHARRALIAGQPRDKGVTLLTLRAVHGDACIYCGVTMLFQSFPKGDRDPRQATLEHRQPISRGGSHTWANCAIACWGCNISKGAKTEAEFMAIRLTA